MAIDRNGPIQMLNLVRLREFADYGDGRRVTGAAAYATYGREITPCLDAVGGKVVWSGQFEMTLIGPQDEVWDICFIVEYPSADAFMDMMRDPAYQQGMIHRQAAVQTSRLIRLNPEPDSGL
ncbi:MAG: DUF1330 domain-containing protein [Rhodobacterales bacterium]|nr:DUF1330 domain-containing protein [Rhodobacterales bacterium]